MEKLEVHSSKNTAVLTELDYQNSFYNENTELPTQHRSNNIKIQWENNPIYNQDNVYGFLSVKSDLNSVSAYSQDHKMFSHNDIDLNDNQDRIEAFNESSKSINMNTYDSDIYFNDQSFENLKCSAKPSFQH